jgi:hypothetical protein
MMSIILAPNRSIIPLRNDNDRRLLNASPSDTGYLGSERRFNKCIASPSPAFLAVISQTVRRLDRSELGDASLLSLQEVGGIIDGRLGRAEFPGRDLSCEQLVQLGVASVLGLGEEEEQGDDGESGEWAEEETDLGSPSGVLGGQHERDGVVEQDVHAGLHESGDTCRLRSQRGGRHLDQGDPADRSDRDRVGGDPHGDESDHGIARRRAQVGEPDTSHCENAHGHERATAQEQRSTPDLVDQVERGQDTAEEDRVDDDVGGERVVEPDKREEVDDVEHERYTDKVL